VSGPGELTLTSIVLFTLGAYGVAAGAASGEQSVVAVGVFAFALFLIGIVWPIVALSGVELEAWSRTDVSVGEPYEVNIRLHGSCSRVEVRFADLPGDAWVTASPSAGVLPRVASRRGVYRVLRFELRSSAPLGVFVRSRVVRARLPFELVVAPRPAAQPASTAPVTHSLRERPIDAPVAFASPRSPGGGDTVRAVRPYVPGDAARLVHWPTSARLGTLVVREHEPPPAVGIALVVDLNGDPDDVEEAASRAAGIGAATLAAGGAVWCCTSEPAGPVSARALDRRDLGRRLARAGAGQPGAPPEGWPVEVVRA
jgi:uncharacterized protein (DUF58 family)